MMASVSNSLVCGDAAFRTADKIAAARSSSQSWMTSMIR
jgi:hypothetical protein